MLATGLTVCCRLRQFLVLTALTALTTALLLSPRLLLSQVGGLVSLLSTLRLIFLPVPTTLCSNKPVNHLQACQRESPRQFPRSSSSSLLVLSACRMGDWRLQQEHQHKCRPSHGREKLCPIPPGGDAGGLCTTREGNSLAEVPFS